MRSGWIRYAGQAGMAGFVAFVFEYAGPAGALENEPAYRPGVLEGIPIGAALPPGWYFGATSTYYTGEKQNGYGNDNPLGVRINKFVSTLSGIWVPGFELLGASYSFVVIQPVATVSVNVHGGTGFVTVPDVGRIPIPVAGSSSNGWGLADTGIFPINLSWAPADHWYVTGSLGFYAPTGAYTPTSENINAVNIGDGYWTLEPSLGITYLTPEGHLSANLVYDKALENGHLSTISTTGGGTLTGHYQSGDMLMLDFSAVKFEGNWNFGVSGYFAAQLNDDLLNGADVPAMSIPGLGNTRGAGNIYEKFGVGPLVGYDFGPVKVTAYYNHDFFAYNTLKAESFWLRTSFKLP